MILSLKGLALLGVGVLGDGGEVEDGVADFAVVESLHVVQAGVGDGFAFDLVKAVGAVPGFGEERAHRHGRGDGAYDFAVGGGALGEVDIVHDGRGGFLTDDGEGEAAADRGGAADGLGHVAFGVAMLFADGLELDLRDDVREGEGGQAPEGPLQRPGDGARGENERQAGVVAEVDAGADHVGFASVHEVAEGDVDAVAGRAVERVGGAAEGFVFGEVDFAASAHGAADPALFAHRGGHDHFEVIEHRLDQRPQEPGVNAVVVCYQCKWFGHRNVVLKMELATEVRRARRAARRLAVCRMGFELRIGADETRMNV